MLKLIGTWLCAVMTLYCHAQVSLRGSVKDSRENKPLAGATVQLAEANKITVTDDFGRFEFTGLSSGTYTLTVRFVGFEAKSEMVILDVSRELEVVLEESVTLTEEVIVMATRATEKSATTFLTLNKQTIQKQNFGQDLPFILNWTPSLVTTSDAGAGVGYTGLRIRGSDASRINVTINGIPLNDSESQAVFWVNTPDLASSANSIQIQRGVGTSTNGAGAFGASINIQTNTVEAEPFSEITTAIGSFNTQRYTFKAGTGLINDRFAFEGRLSRITSDGYIDRASSDLDAFYLSGGYYGNKTIIKFLTFGGHEVTYQAWYGIDGPTMKTNRTLNYAGGIYDSEGNVRYYDNEVDDYRQNHYQLHFSHLINDYWNVNAALHYTRGKGFYEQYKQEEGLDDLGLPDLTLGDTTITAMDAIVRRWLDNDFYGGTFSLNYEKNATALTVGGGFHTYANARHFGEIIWSQFALDNNIRHLYYDGESQKNDLNIYTKLTHSFSDRFTAFADLQLRYVAYETKGKDNDQSVYDVSETFSFFNPKFGVTYTLNAKDALYASYAVAHREPNRSDFIDNEEKPKREKLHNIEAGWRRRTATYSVEANYYLMNYQDQLVLTGELNDTGYPVRANVGDSYRTGIELSGMIRLSDKISWNANVTYSLNKNVDYVLFNEDNTTYTKDTDITLSPRWIGGSQLSWNAFTGFQASLLSKYVGQQYLDNTQNEALTLDPYFVNDLRLTYGISTKAIKRIEFGLLINNLLNVEYESNGYSYEGVPYYFPQAGRNFMLMASLRF